MGGSVKRGPEELAARARALQAAADEIPDPTRLPGLIPDRYLDDAALDEVRRARALLRRRAQALWAEAGKRHQERLNRQHPETS